MNDKFLGIGEYAKMINLNINSTNMIASNVEISDVLIENEKVLRVVKNNKIDKFDENTYAIVKDFKMHNGIIEVKMLSRLLKDAPDFARGFIGVVYRVNESGSEFESYYVRPANGRHQDPIRKSHGSQYFSYPGYTFEYFREFGILGFEAPVDIGLNEWINLRIEIDDECAVFYVNSEEAVLKIDKMKHGKGICGYLGFYVDTGTEAFFKDLKVTPK